MGKYLGFKFFEHDSSIFYLDTKKKNLFGISTERVTRLKHDSNSIKFIKDEYPKYFLGINNFSSCFSLKHKEYHIKKLKILFQKELAFRVFKPKFIKDHANNIDNIKNSLRFKFILLVKGMFYRELYQLLLSYILDFTTKFNKNLNENIGGLYLNKIIKKTLRTNKINYYDHHLCHAIPAYYFSPYNFKEALVFTLDGKGVTSHSSLWKFDKNSYKLISKSKNLPRKNGESPSTISIGILYSIFTKVLGFRPLSDEGKVEALAAFGKPDKNLLNELNNLFTINEDYLIWQINQNKNEEFTNLYLEEKMNFIGRENFSSTIQFFLNSIVVKYLNLVYEKYKIDTLCLSGGVCANVILNLNIFEKTKFKNIYVFPAMGDDGAACGAALLNAINQGEDLSWLRDFKMPYFGPKIDDEEIKKELLKEIWNQKIEFKKLDKKDIPKLCAKLIKENNIVGMVQGNMEFGPRALGNRSILANPRSKEVKDRINKNIKKRTSFQPFCPSILDEERERLFEDSYDHKHMAIAFRMKKKYYSSLPSAIHIDGTARPQFVSKKDNPVYYLILNELKKINGFGVVLNTSFNLHGRTIVRTPNDTLTDFIDCNLDYLFLGDYLIKRK